MRRLNRFYSSIPILYMAASMVVAAEPKRDAGKMPVAASIETTLSTASRQIRQFAFDGDAATYFCSAQNPGTADDFTLVFDEPVEVKSIAVVTGRPDGGDALDAGKLETSIDGKTFQDRANFSGGMAHAIRPAADPGDSHQAGPAAHPSAGDSRADDRLGAVGGRLWVSGRVHHRRGRRARDQGMGRESLCGCARSRIR